MLQCIAASLGHADFTERLYSAEELSDESLLWGILAQTQWQRASGRWIDDGKADNVSSNSWWATMNAMLIAGLYAALCEAAGTRAALNGVAVTDELTEPWRAYARDPRSNTAYWAAHSAALDFAEPRAAPLLAHLSPVERSFAVGWIATAHRLGTLGQVLTTRRLAALNNLFLPQAPLVSLHDKGLTSRQLKFVTAVIAKL